MSSRLKIYSLIFVVFLIFLLVPRGSSVFNTNISLAPDGKPVFASTLDKKAPFSLNDGNLQKAANQSGLYGQSIEKTDYGFVAYYKVFYRLNLSAAPRNITAKFVFSADLPGQITSVKNGTLQGSKAFWTIKAGQKGEFFAESKTTRWWLVFLAAFLSMGAAFVLVIGRRGKN